MKLKLSLILGALLLAITLLVAQASVASPIVTVIPVGWYGIMECEPGADPVPSIAADGERAILTCFTRSLEPVRK